ncbi:MAG: hypothetical protein JJE01_09455, partial [Gemmatimonadetes bacterium]|nr:hypothetical protein [Gemmatimonadota bacterium]
DGWRVEWLGAGRPAFIDRRGQLHFSGKPLPPQLPPDPVETLIAETRSRGADPDYLTAGARWKREDDIPDEIYYKALEALGGG